MSEKVKCILAYLLGWVGGLVVLLAFKDNEKNTKFHAAQAIVLSVGYDIILVLYAFIPISIPFLTTALWVLYIVCVVMGIAKANKEEKPELPVIGNVTKSVFSKLLGE